MSIFLISRFPSEEALAEFAEKQPDRYILAMTQLAKIAGFSDRKEVLVDFLTNVQGMSDSELATIFATSCSKLPLS